METLGQAGQLQRYMETPDCAGGSFMAPSSGGEWVKAADVQALLSNHVLMPKSPNEEILAPDGWARMEWARYQAMLAVAADTARK